MSVRFSYFILWSFILGGVLVAPLSLKAEEACNCKANTGGNVIKNFGLGPAASANDLARCSLVCTGRESFGKTVKEKYEAKDIAQIIGNIINGLLVFLGVAFMVLVVYAGGTWMLAGGDTEKVSAAKHILQSALLGILIVVSAYVIMNFVFEQLLKLAFSV